MTDTKLIDSSVWLDYLINTAHKDLIEEKDILLLSSLSIFEIKKKLFKSNIGEAYILKSLEFIKNRGMIIPVSAQIAEEGANIAIKEDLSIADSIIYTTARLNNAQLLTLDNEFRGLENVKII